MLLFLNGLFLLLNSFNVDHDIHLSTCLIEYNQVEKALQITLHIYIDDLEDALELEGHKDLYICTKKEAALAEAHMEAYLRKHFILSVNGQEVNYNFLGKEVSDDFLAAWCYIEVENVNSLSELGVTNDVLLELYDDQRNVIQMKGPNKKRGSFILSRKKATEVVKF